MKTKLKKSMALLISAGICASMMASPASAADVKFSLNESSESGRDAKLIKATYTDGDILDKAQIIDAKIDANADTYTYTDADVKNGVKYFLWDSIGGMKPLAPAGTISDAPPVNTEEPTDTPDPTAEYTVKIGTVTGGDEGDVMIVKTPANSPAPTDTPAPTAVPGPTATPAPPYTPSENIWKASEKGSQYDKVRDPAPFTVGSLTVDLLDNEPGDGDNAWKMSGSSLTGSDNPRSAGGGNVDVDNAPVTGTVAKLTTEVVGTAAVEVIVNSDKTMNIYSFDSGSSSGGTVIVTEKSANKDPKTYQFAVEPGKDYYVFASGSKISFNSFDFKPNAAEANIAISTSSVTEADGEVLVDTLTVHAGDKITVKAHKADDLEELKLTTAPEAEINGPVATDEANSAEYYTFTMPAADTTVNAAYEKTALPKDEAWTAADEELNDIIFAVDEGKPFGPYNGLSGYGKWTKSGGELTYTHTDGTEYKLPHGWNAGSGGDEKRNFHFTPKQACIVTVIYTAASDRPVYIAQGKAANHLAEGTEGAKDGHPAVITADIEDPSNGEVYVVGGSNNKQIYGIFADYYDPNVIVNQKVSGKVDYSGSANTENTKIVFTDTKDQTRYEVAFGTDYTTELRQNRSYDISIEENDVLSDKLAVTLDTNSVDVAKKEKTHDIKVVDIELTEVKGDVVVHEYTPNDSSTLDLSNVSLTFTATDDAKYTYEVPAGGIADNKYTVTMMPGHTYTVTASGIDGYALSELSGSYVMAPGDTQPFKNILITENLGEVKFEKEIQVGSDKTYTKIGDAMAAIRAMENRPEGEEGRVTVLVDPGTYTEQVIVDKPYITIKAANENDKPKIEWYYGIGYLYYSSAGNKYYSEDYAVAKTKKGTVDRWGCAVRITGTNVNLEGIIVRNTFSCFVSDAEIADGVAPSMNGEYSDVTGKPDRTVKDYDPMTKTAVERAAAIAMDADFTELYNCEFISSQDTFYTNKIGYVKDCYIEGGTDYIFGGNSIVFDGCTLAWHGYSDAPNGGYITANKNGANPVPGTPDTASNGYLLKNCTVTTSKYYKDNKFAAGGWGRNWGGAQTQVVFDGVTVNTEMPKGWTPMGGELKNSILYVNNVTDKDGKQVDVSGTEYNPNGTMETNNYKIYDMTDYFGGWTPPHYNVTP